MESKTMPKYKVVIPTTHEYTFDVEGYNTPGEVRENLSEILFEAAGAIATDVQVWWSEGDAHIEEIQPANISA